MAGIPRRRFVWLSMATLPIGWTRQRSLAFPLDLSRPKVRRILAVPRVLGQWALPPDPRPST
eukprot:scaffold363_cov331-Pavlova_lutheri.AAC.97